MFIKRVRWNFVHIYYNIVFFYAIASCDKISQTPPNPLVHFTGKSVKTDFYASSYCQLGLLIFDWNEYILYIIYFFSCLFDASPGPAGRSWCKVRKKAVKN